MKLENHFVKIKKRIFKSGRWKRKNAYFGLLGYTNSFASRNKPVLGSVEVKCTAEMKETYRTNYKLNVHGVRAKTYWRRSSFKHACLAARRLHIRNRKWKTFCRPAHLFDEAQERFLVFCRTFSKDESQSSLHVFTLTDAGIVESVDSYKYMSQVLKHTKRYIGDLERSSYQEA